MITSPQALPVMLHELITLRNVVDCGLGYLSFFWIIFSFD